VEVFLYLVISPAQISNLLLQNLPPSLIFKLMKVTLSLLLLSLVLLGCVPTAEHIPPSKGAKITSRTWRAPVPPQPNTAGTGAVVGKTEHVVEDKKKGTGAVVPGLPSFYEITEIEYEQGDNPSSKSKLSTKPDGSFDLSAGTTAANEVIIPPAPDNTKYIVLAASILAIAGGIFLLSNGWPILGKRLAISGAAGTILSLTIDKYGAYYAGAVLIGGLLLVWEKYHAYQIGLKQPTPATDNAA
jgi:hypothetical protein